MLNVQTRAFLFLVRVRDSRETRAPSGGNGGSNKKGLTSDPNSSITESPHPGAPQASMFNPQ